MIFMPSGLHLLFSTLCPCIFSLQQYFLDISHLICFHPFVLFDLYFVSQVSIGNPIVGDLGLRAIFKTRHPLVPVVVRPLYR